MLISVAEANGRLDELMDLAEAGEEVILTRHGQSAVRFMPIQRKLTREERRRVLEEVMRDSAGKALPGESAARSQDFLYDEYGLPK